MKINKVHITNINSLKGEVWIDFTEPPLAYTGLFAITGDTGAGKTTILDAITLALYGNVPRSKSVKELMSYGTAEAVAEVEFEVTGDLYRAKWTDWRARGKFNGKLQGPKRELARWNEEQQAFEIIAEKIREVDEEIVERTGLDYNRFRRSVLLAQGDFAAFLEANEGERGELLERITGTELYSDLSMAAYQRAKLEREALEKLDLQLTGVALLLPEELEQLETQRQQWEAETTELEQQIQVLQKQLKAYEEARQLKEKVSQAQIDLDALRQKKEQAATEFKRLTAFEQVKHLRPRYDQLLGLRTEIKELQNKITQRKASREDLIKNQVKQEAAVQKAEQNYQAVRAYITEQKPKWEKTQALDTEMDTLLPALQELELEVEQKEQTLEQLQEKIVAQEEQLKTRQQQLLVLTDWLHQRRGWEPVVEQLPLLREKNRLYQEYVNRQQTLEQRIADLHQKEENKLAETNQLEAALAQSKKQAKDLWNAFLKKAPDTLITDRAELLQKLLQKIQAYEREQLDLQKAKKELAEYERLLQKMANIQDEYNALSRASNRYNNLILNQLDLLMEVELQHQYKWKIYQQQQLIANYEKDRANLVAGEACPLCGATDHPYTVHLPETYINEAKADYEKQDAFLRKCKTEYQQLLADQSRTNQEIRSRQQTLEQLETQLPQHEAALAEVFPQFSFEEAQIHLDGAVLEAQIDRKKAYLEGAQSIQTELKDLHEKLSKTELQITEQEQSLQNLNFERKLDQKEAEQAKQQLEELGKEQEAALQMLEKYLGIMDISGKSLSRGMEDLEQQLKYFQAQKEQLNQLEKAQNEQAQKQQQLRDRQSQIKEHLNQQVERLKKSRKNYQDKANERQHLLEDRDPRKERAEQEQRLTQLEKEKGDLQQEYQQIEQQLVSSKELLAEEEQRQDKLQERESKLQAALNQELPKYGLNDLAALAATMLSAENEAEIREKRSVLDQEAARLDGLLEDRQKALKSVNQQIEKAASEAILQQELDRNQLKNKELLSSLGGLKERIEANEKRKAEQQHLLEQRADQDQIYRRWAALNEIIGSADGKKFRTFAQGLTLERLVSIANHHLSALNGRYELLKPADEDLGLRIIDTYQADHQRSPDTLSGGEKFLVSLALALGLSDLAGRQAQIRSLFIDEGFGTLDENSLDLAITTLENLQASGKTIGVISHVKALKERIGTRIEVHKQSDGFSSVAVQSG